MEESDREVHRNGKERNQNASKIMERGTQADGDGAK